jgi:hypothetical protein
MDFLNSLDEHYSHGVRSNGKLSKMSCSLVQNTQTTGEDDDTIYVTISVNFCSDIFAQSNVPAMNDDLNGIVSMGDTMKKSIRRKNISLDSNENRRESLMMIEFQCARPSIGNVKACDSIISEVIDYVLTRPEIRSLPYGACTFTYNANSTIMAWDHFHSREFIIV